MKIIVKSKIIFNAISIILLLFQTINLNCQTEKPLLKFIPQISLKIGSQNPHIGCQLDMAGGIILKNRYFIGIGGGYSSDMGMGGKTFPLYSDARIYFSPTKNFLLPGKDELNQFEAEFRIGILINNNNPYKTGFNMAVGLAYLFDFVKIKNFRIPPFYLGPNLEYVNIPFVDEYRGYKIKDGRLEHLIFNLKIAFNIKPFKL